MVTTQINENGDHNVLINRKIEGLELGDLPNPRGVPTDFYGWLQPKKQVGTRPLTS